MMGRGEYGGGGGGMVMGAAAGGWVGRLVEERFFVGCGVHESRKKNERNIFCLHCCASVCSHCASSHSSHSLLQVRRYVYHDVVRLNDLEKLIDCSYVQAYTINSAKVVFLKARPQTRAFKGSGNICLTCERILQQPYHFCSLSCKMGHAVSSSGGGGGRGGFADPRLEDLEVDDLKKKKKKKSEGGGLFPELMISLSNRRKGAFPQRAPLS